MGIRKDLTGQRFGRLTAISSRMDSDNRRCVWLCKCDCGNYKEFKSATLISGRAQSCGCLHNEIISKMSTTHGMSKTRLYSVWKGMRTRCYNPNSKSYKNYGGRGILICDEWKNDFLSFYLWAFANGYNPNAKHFECTLDRIDVDGNYCPENCRWVSNTQQANNTRSVSRYTINGVEHTMTDWCNIYSIPKENVQARLQLGWDFEKAVSTPVKKCHKKVVTM